MEGYTRTAVERAMKVHEVILRARAKKITWLQAAEVLGIHPRTMRRWKRKMDQHGVHSLVDQRSRIPSPRRVPGAEIDQILELYRERYQGFNVRHFHDVVTRDHGVRRCYTLVKRVLQGAGLVRKQRARGKHRRRRERQACFGEMLHLDGSRHRWLTAVPEQWHTLITVVDDATGRLLYAQLWPSESRLGVMTALGAVFREQGLPQRLYTDRAAWAAHTPRAGGKADARACTQVQRALEELGIEHLRAYSPQARGRSERVNRTLQGRVVNELRARRIITLEEANRFLVGYRAEYDQRFARSPADPASGFVALGRVDLDHYLCVRVTRRVGPDNTVALGKVVLQIPKQTQRRSCQGMHVTVRQHLDGRFTIHAGLRRLAVYDRCGHLRPPESQVRAAPDRRSGAILRSRFRRAAAKWRPKQKRTDHLSKTSGQITC
jgi:transposase